MPNDWTPRPYQLNALKALDSGVKRVISIWHRRAGKDSTAINYTAKSACSKVGTYWHLLPTQRQARKAIWQGIGKNERRFINQTFPDELVTRKNDAEMLIELSAGSIWQLAGGDNYDSLVGSNPRGVVFSEFSLMDSYAWDYVRPILAENGGWAWFIFTPRGRNNHAWRLYEQNKNNPEWHCEVLTVDDTQAVSPEAIEQERLSGMTDEMINQEFYCNPDSANHGTVYGRMMEGLVKSGKITNVPHNPAYPVETAWDIGFRDNTAIWFIQRIENDVNVIDFHTDRGKPLTHYWGEIFKKPYNYSRHIGPHDLDHTEQTTGVTRKQAAAGYGINYTVVPRSANADQEEAARNLLPMCRFDAEKCKHGIDALTQWHRVWDRDKSVLSKDPVHDWSSHACKAFAYYAQTPATYGLLPSWAVNLARKPASGQPTDHNWWQGTVASEGFDPLGAMR